MVMRLISMRAVMGVVAAAAAMAANAVPLFSIAGGAPIVFAATNSFAYIVGQSGNEGGVLSLTESGLITIEYLGKEAALTNSFQWNGAGSQNLGTVATTAAFPPLVEGNLAAPTVINPPGSVVVPGTVAAGVLPFAFLINGVTLLTNAANTTGNLVPNIAFLFPNPADQSQIYLLLDDKGAGAEDNHDDMIIRLTAAVPEPSTYLMLLAGLAMIGFMAKRRART